MRIQIAARNRKTGYPIDIRSMPMNPHRTTVEKLRTALPEVSISTEPGVLQSHGQDWTRFRTPAPLAVAFPAKVAEVQKIVRHAATIGLPLVPSGGRTGLSGGAVAAAGELVVSLDRMRQVLHYDPTDRSVTVEAGVVTATVQSFARDQGLYYPVSFASEGSSQIGGNIATNAGGIRVLRHGLTRERVSGLKVVTGTGELLDCNRGLIKNASGYDLRHLFIGSEGTLGLIVEATLRLSDPRAPCRRRKEPVPSRARRPSSGFRSTRHKAAALDAKRRTRAGAQSRTISV